MKKLKLIFAKAMKILLHPPALRNVSINRKSKVCSGSELTNVSIGNYSYVGNNCFVVNTKIGNFCSIADRCLIGGATHPIYRVSTSPVFHNGKNVLNKNFADFESIKTPETIIGNDVWIGMGCIIKAGIKIGNGSILGMGSVLTKDIPPYEIWGGNPARKIKDRFDKDKVELLMKTEWWNLNDNDISKLANKFDDIEKFLNDEQDVKK